MYLKICKTRVIQHSKVKAHEKLQKVSFQNLITFILNIVAVCGRVRVRLLLTTKKYTL